MRVRAQQVITKEVEALERNARPRTYLDVGSSPLCFPIVYINGNGDISLAIFLILVLLVGFIILWRNGFFRKVLGIYRESETGNKRSRNINGKRDIATAREPVFLAGKVEIPEWRATWYARWDEVTPRHRTFYEYWKEHLEKGDFINIGDNVGYIFMYMKLVINQFKKDKNIENFRERFHRLQRAYGEKKDVQTLLGGWLLHAYLFLGDYAGAWNSRKDMGYYDSLDISDVVFFDRQCGGVSIDGQAVISILKSNTAILTEFGKEHQREIANIATSFLNSYHEKHDKNLIVSLHERFASVSSSEEAKQSKYTKVFDLFDFPGPSIHSDNEFSMGAIKPASEWDIHYSAVPQTIEAGIKGVLRTVVRECENIVREEKGLPRVGEGWISETRLFKDLCVSFPNERVVHQARPAWLGQQHLDIYFPARNVAVEYQGAQHERPIEFFGGEEAFKKQQERDRRKRRLCEEHGCRLIYAYPGCDISDIERQIREGRAPLELGQ